MKKYFVITEDGTVVYSSKSMIKAIGWVLHNCKVDSENDNRNRTIDFKKI